MTADSDRAAFEAAISGPPYERDIARWPDDDPKRHSWPGMYQEFSVALAWEMWQEAAKQDANEIEACFAAGRDAPESAKCPHHPATREAHWWARGFVYTARLLRAIDAERDAKRYRRLGALVEFGDWGVCSKEILDSFGRTEETHMADKTDMDAWLDKPEVIAEAEACAIALAKRHGIPAPLEVAP